MTPGIHVEDSAQPSEPAAAGPANAVAMARAAQVALSRLMTLRRLGPRHATSATVRVSRAFGASATRVFRSWLDAGVAARWLFATAGHPLEHATLDARVGGAFHLCERRVGGVVDYAGTYLEIAPPLRLAFTLSIDDGTCPATRVTVVIASRKKGCELTLTHENVPHAHAPHLEGRWAGALYGLAETLDEIAAGRPAPRRES